MLLIFKVLKLCNFYILDYKGLQYRNSMDIKFKKVFICQNMNLIFAIHSLNIDLKLFFLIEMTDALKYIS